MAHLALDRLAGRATEELSTAGFSSLAADERRDLERRVVEPDILIIGAGMSGMAVALALRRYGINRTLLVEAANNHSVGAWSEFARMKELRSQKGHPGPSLGLPSLSFQAWFEAQYGRQKWIGLSHAATTDWVAYLRWFRAVLRPATLFNHTAAQIVGGRNRGLAVVCRDEIAEHTIRPSRLVLATGLLGMGGERIPNAFAGVIGSLCKHGSDCIDFGELYGKEVIVVGGGASGLDNSAAALESGAKAVTLISRRGHFPMVNTAVRSVDPKHLAGFADLPAHERKRLLAAFIGAGIPPPRLSIQRLLGFHNFCHRAFDVIRANTDGKRISLLSSNETITADFVILCTGFEGAPLKRPELETLVASSNVVPVSNGSSEDIEFAVDRWHRLSPRSTQDQWVRQIYYLGPGCKARHGVTAGDIVSLPLAATRIAESIASAHFREHIAAFHQLIESDS